MIVGVLICNAKSDWVVEPGGVTSFTTRNIHVDVRVWKNAINKPFYAYF